MRRTIFRPGLLEKILKFVLDASETAVAIHYASPWMQTTTRERATATRTAQLVSLSRAKAQEGAPA